MTVFLVLMIGVFAIAAAAALVKGLMAFVRDAENLRMGERQSDEAFGLKQNRMITQRVLFQGIAILLVALIGVLAGQA